MIVIVVLLLSLFAFCVRSQQLPSPPSCKAGSILYTPYDVFVIPPSTRADVWDGTGQSLFDRLQCSHTTASAPCFGCGGGRDACSHVIIYVTIDFGVPVSITGIWLLSAESYYDVFETVTASISNSTAVPSFSQLASLSPRFSPAGPSWESFYDKPSMRARFLAFAFRTQATIYANGHADEIQICIDLSATPIPVPPLTQCSPSFAQSQCCSSGCSYCTSAVLGSSAKCLRPGSSECLNAQCNKAITSTTTTTMSTTTKTTTPTATTTTRATTTAVIPATCQPFQGLLNECCAAGCVLCGAGGCAPTIAACSVNPSQSCPNNATTVPPTTTTTTTTIMTAEPSNSASIQSSSTAVSTITMTTITSTNSDSNTNTNQSTPMSTSSEPSTVESTINTIDSNANNVMKDPSGLSSLLLILVIVLPIVCLIIIVAMALVFVCVLLPRARKRRDQESSRVVTGSYASSTELRSVNNDASTAPPARESINNSVYGTLAIANSKENGGDGQYGSTGLKISDKHYSDMEMQK